jgi:hypothetical protein
VGRIFCLIISHPQSGDRKAESPSIRFCDSDIAVFRARVFDIPNNKISQADAELFLTPQAPKTELACPILRGFSGASDAHRRLLVVFLPRSPLTFSFDRHRVGPTGSIDRTAATHSQCRSWAIAADQFGHRAALCPLLSSSDRRTAAHRISIRSPRRHARPPQINVRSW